LQLEQLLYPYILSEIRTKTEINKGGLQISLSREFLVLLVILLLLEIVLAYLKSCVRFKYK